MTWAGLALILFGNFVDTAAAPYPGWRATLPVAGAAAVIIGGTPVPSWGAERVLGLRPVRAVGRWSYGMYLWDIPVVLLAAYWWGPVNLPGRVALILVTVVIAAISFAFYETPIRRSPRLIASPTLSLACAAAFMVGALVTISLVAR
jgi:peptidoglycan/LPS O-acetylase OafA/YrhL